MELHTSRGTQRSKVDSREGAKKHVVSTDLKQEFNVGSCFLAEKLDRFTVCLIENGTSKRFICLPGTDRETETKIRTHQAYGRLSKDTRDVTLTTLTNPAVGKDDRHCVW